MKKIIFGLLGSTMLLASFSALPQANKNLNAFSQDTKEKYYHDINLDAVESDLDSVDFYVTIDNNLTNPISVGTELRDASDNMIDVVLQDNGTFGLHADNLSRGVNYSGWTIYTLALQNGVYYRQTINVPTFSLLPKYDSDLVITNIEPEHESVDIFYDLTTNMPSRKTWLSVLDENNQVLSTKTIVDDSGKITIRNLNEGTVYDSWTIRLANDWVTFDYSLGEFKTNSGQNIDFISGSIYNVTDTSVTFGYDLQSNIDPAEIAISIYYKNTLIEREPDSILQGRITIDGLEQGTEYSNLQISANYIVDPEISSTSFLPSFTTKITDGHIFYLLLSSLEAKSTSIEIYYMLGTNFDRADEIISVYDGDHNLVSTNSQDKLLGSIIVNYLTPNTQYVGWTLEASYSFNSNVYSVINIPPFTTTA